MCSADFVILR